jgi:3-oxoacyl-[acyl-carrier-protein] synthase-3
MLNPKGGRADGYSLAGDGQLGRRRPCALEVIVAAPARRGYRVVLATQLDVAPERIVVAEDEKMHTASLAAALQQALNHLPIGARILLVTAGAGITAGATLYREPPIPNWVSAR